MLERIFWCFLASVAFWLALISLTSEQTPQGTTVLSYFALYVDLFLTVLVFGALCGAHVLPLLFLRALNRRPVPANEATDLVKVSQEVERWQPTTVSVIESYKAQLRQIEERARYLEESERRSREFYKEDPGGFAIWLCERGLSILRKQCWKESGTAQSLRQTIHRLYSGDIDRELLDYQEQIAELRSQRNSGNSDSFVSQMINDSLDRKIRLCERNIIELEAWRNKVAAANPVSPYEPAWQNFLDYARRTTVAPLVEATYRVQATFAGIELKHRFEQIATDEWRKGRLSDEELAYIQKRIRDQFLQETKSSYA